jgi:hypothetical protein
MWVYVSIIPQIRQGLFWFSVPWISQQHFVLQNEVVSLEFITQSGGPDLSIYILTVLSFTAQVPGSPFVSFCDSRG